jgi:hypothetical protein
MYCYQGNTEPYIDLDAKHAAPITLEDYLVTHPDKFQMVGRLEGKKATSDADGIASTLEHVSLDIKPKRMDVGIERIVKISDELEHKKKTKKEKSTADQSGDDTDVADTLGKKKGKGKSTADQSGDDTDVADTLGKKKAKKGKGKSTVDRSED